MVVFNIFTNLYMKLHALYIRETMVIVNMEFIAQYSGDWLTTNGENIDYKFQIQRIREESQDMIDKVRSHKEKITAKVEGFHTKLMTKEDGLKKTQAQLTHLLKDGHVTEKIRQKKRITEELDRHDANKLGDCKLADPPTLIHNAGVLTSVNKTFVLLVFLSVNINVNLEF